MPVSRRADKSATDDELAELCRTEARSPPAQVDPRADRRQLNGRGWKIENEARDTTNTVDAPLNAVAVVVNIRTPGGKFVIGKAAPERSGVQMVDQVTVDNAEQLMIWGWERGWVFYALGAIDVRWLIKQ